MKDKYKKEKKKNSIKKISIIQDVIRKKSEK